jgi:hypothetical protein
MRRKIKSGAGDNWAHEIVRSPALYKWRILSCPPTLLRRRRSHCCPDAGIKPAEAILPMTVANKPGHRGEHEGSRKTIAREMPGRSGMTVVTTLVCFLLAREAAGALAPAFPAPSLGARTFTAKLAHMRRDREAVSTSLRAKAKQSIFLCGTMDCFASLAMTAERGPHTRSHRPVKPGDDSFCKEAK